MSPPPHIPLIEITAESHGVEIDLAYATPRNISGKPVYTAPVCYLHVEAAGLLARAVTLSGKLGLRLKIFDAFRPEEAQWLLWEARPDPEFLADPREGSLHSRGAAIDLTLIDHAGAELDMGTGFDAFTPLSHHGNTEIPLEAQRNRFLLLGIMSAAGWDFHRKEWWHYQLFDPRRHSLISDTALPKRMMA